LQKSSLFTSKKDLGNRRNPSLTTSGHFYYAIKDDNPQRSIENSKIKKQPETNHRAHAEAETIKE
jgi:poly(3-hydroxyalkanoate) synthetase